MTETVAVYREDGTQIGQTFPRRARQLVMRQRAAWADDMKSAIRLAPDADDEWEEETDTRRHDEREERPGRRLEEQIYELARSRVKERGRFVWHSVALLPGYFILILITVNFLYYDGEGYFFAGMLYGWWTTWYGIHLIAFVKPRLKGFRWASEEERIRREVERLKRL